MQIHKSPSAAVVVVVETNLLVVDITEVGPDHVTDGEEDVLASESRTIIITTILLPLLVRASMDSATSVRLACVALHSVALVSSAHPTVGHQVHQDRLGPTKAPIPTMTDKTFPTILIIMGVVLAADPTTSTWVNSYPT
jgi:hypothetical protein